MAGVSTKKRKIGFRIAACVISFAAFAAALTAAIFLSMLKTDGYYTFGSTRGFVAADDLMDKEENFDRFRAGDMVLFDADADFENGIGEGQIVLFRKSIDGTAAIAARRVDSKEIVRLSSGVVVVTYRLKADNSENALPFDVAPSEILGVYRGVSQTAGAFFGFLDSFAGFVVLVLLPAAVGLIFALFLIFSYLRNRD